MPGNLWSESNFTQKIESRSRSLVDLLPPVGGISKAPRLNHRLPKSRSGPRGSTPAGGRNEVGMRRRTVSSPSPQDERERSAAPNLSIRRNAQGDFECKYEPCPARPRRRRERNAVPNLPEQHSAQGVSNVRTNRDRPVPTEGERNTAPNLSGRRGVKGESRHSCPLPPRGVASAGMGRFQPNPTASGTV